MPQVSQKNQVLSAAAQDLNLGTQLQQQVEDEVANRKKKTQQMNSSAAQSLSPAVMSLFGAGGAGG